MNDTEKGYTIQDVLTLKVLRKGVAKTFCGCIDLQTGSYVVATSTLIFGIVEVCMGLIGIRIAIEETMKVGISICSGILTAFALLLIFFSFLLYVAVQQSDSLLMEHWLNFAGVFTFMCVLYVILCIVFLAGGWYTSKRAPIWTIVAIIIFTFYGGFLVYGQIVVASYNKVVKERRKVVEELREIKLKNEGNS